MTDLANTRLPPDVERVLIVEEEIPMQSHDNISEERHLGEEEDTPQ